VYALESPVGKVYAGKSTTARGVYSRWKKYRIGEVENDSHLKRALLRYGTEAFVFHVLLVTDDDPTAVAEEKRLIQALDLTNPARGYNMTSGGDGLLGYRHRPESRALMSQRMRGTGNPNYGKKSWMSGRKHTEESKEKNRQKHLGRKVHTPESLARFLRCRANADFHRGRKASAETREKMSQSHRRRGAAETPEQREARISRCYAAWAVRKAKRGVA
jgi:group I intron endonuclease